MTTKKQAPATLKAIRWDDQDWLMLATIAKRMGLTRSAFVKRAALGEAGKVLAGAAPHYVSGPQASTHNGGANTFSNAKRLQKRVPEEIGAGVPPPEARPKAKRRADDERVKPKPKAG